MIKKGSKVILNDKYEDWAELRDNKVILTVRDVGTIGDNYVVAWFEEITDSALMKHIHYNGCYALDGLKELAHHDCAYYDGGDVNEYCGMTGMCICDDIPCEEFELK